MSIPSEVLKKVKLLELKTKKLVNSLFAGEYHSAFKGQGMTFSDFREYVPGDDVRNISWPLSAKAGKTFIKTFEEERELTLIIAVDMSGSLDFGSNAFLKSEVLTHLSALLAFSAIQNNDQVGLLLFTDRVEHYVPPKKGRGQVQRLLRDLYYFKTQSQKTKLSEGLQFLQGVLKKKSTVFVLSDFLDEGFERSLRLLGQKHEVVACVVEDAYEKQFPPLGLVDFEDPETGATVTVDTSSDIFQKEFKQKRESIIEMRNRQLRQSRVDRVDIPSTEDYVQPLVAYFKRR